MKSRKAILSADAASDERFGMAQSIADFSIRSMMCAPMMGNDGQPIGVIQIDTLNQRSRFTDSDLEVLASVASQAAVSIDNAKMHEQVIAQRAMQRDLELARRMQRALMPSKPPQVPGYYFFDYYQAAREVGGDYYDYVPLPGGRYAVIVGDVAGKGVPAALLMARLSADVRFSLASEADPAKAVEQINEGFCQPRLAGQVRHHARGSSQSADGRFVDGQRRPHGPDLAPARRQRFRNRRRSRRPAARRRAGMEYESYAHRLEPGDVVTIFTDGFSEAMNGQRELYGLERLKQQLSSPVLNVRDFGQHILDDVHQFVNGYDQSDDMCLVCFGREEA